MVDTFLLVGVSLRYQAFLAVWCCDQLSIVDLSMEKTSQLVVSHFFWPRPPSVSLSHHLDLGSLSDSLWLLFILICHFAWKG